MSQGEVEADSTLMTEDAESAVRSPWQKDGHYCAGVKECCEDNDTESRKEAKMCSCRDRDLGPMADDLRSGIEFNRQIIP